MSKIDLKSPGSIPNYTLKKNLQLNSKYISNDGGDEGISIDNSGNTGINIQNYMTPGTKFEVFNNNVQYSTGTAYQTSASIVGSGTTFTSDMVGGRFIFDDGTDAGIITNCAATIILGVTSSQTVGAADDFRSYKIYYPSVQIDIGATTTSLKIGNLTLSQDEIDLSTSGNFSVDAAADITLSADGGNITMNDGTNTIFDFDVDNTALTIRDNENTDDYFKISVLEHGVTNIITQDDGGGTSAALTFNADGLLHLHAASGYVRFDGPYMWINVDTRAASGTADNSLLIEETLNLSSGAGGSDNHFGVYYNQTQTDLTGWDNVYLMTLTGGGNTFYVDKDAKISAGVELKLQYDANNYMSIDVAANGVTTLTTIDQGVGEVAHLTLDIDGEIINDSKVGRTRFYLNGGTADYAQIRVLLNGATEFSTIDADASDAHLSIVPDGELILDAQNSDGNSNHGIQLKANAAGEGEDSQLFGVLTQHHVVSHFTLYEGGGTSTDDYFNIAVAAEGATTISTVDANAAVAHLTLDSDGDIILDAATGNIILKNDGGNYTPGSDYEAATKKYVDDNAGGITTGKSIAMAMIFG